MSEQLSWGILATGRIAGLFAKGLARSRTGRLVAVGSRTMHAEWSVKAAEAGKHILCEKPLTLNHAEAMAVIEAARRHDVFLMEAFMYRCHPQTAKLVDLIRSQAIGEVRVIQATFSFDAPFDPQSRLFSNALGGGGILDVGCYCTSMARLIAGAATGEDFAEPIDVQAAGQLTSTGVDAYTVAVLTFPGGIVAELATGVQVSQENVVRIFGSEGHLVVPIPWSPCHGPGTSRILLHRTGEPEPQEIRINTDRGLYTIEADTVAAHIDRRQVPPPCTTRRSSARENHPDTFCLISTGVHKMRDRRNPRFAYSVLLFSFASFGALSAVGQSAGREALPSDPNQRAHHAARHLLESLPAFERPIRIPEHVPFAKADPPFAVAGEVSTWRLEFELATTIEPQQTLALAVSAGRRRCAYLCGKGRGHAFSGFVFPKGYCRQAQRSS